MYYVLCSNQEKKIYIYIFLCTILLSVLFLFYAIQWFVAIITIYGSY